MHFRNLPPVFIGGFSFHILTGTVERICVSNNINYINLFDIFKNNNPDKLYFRAGDNHWNDKGQDIAAQETASFVLNRYMLTD